MDSDSHANRDAGVANHKRDSSDLYANRYKHPNVYTYSNLHVYPNVDGNCFCTSHQYIYSNAYALVHTDPDKYESANDHVHTLVHTPTDVHVYTFDHTLPNHCGPIT